MPALTDLTWPVRTERLAIRLHRPEDLDEVWDYRRLASVQEWQGRAPVDQAAWVTTFTEPERATRTLVVERDGLVIGDLMLDVGDAWSQREVADRAEASEAGLGYSFHPDHGGRGYATEAVRAAIGVCFTPVAEGGLGLRRVTASCFADNVASWRLMERLGMRREQHGVRDSLHRDRGWLDGYTYALLAEEWSPAQRGSSSPCQPPGLGRG